MLMLIMKTGPHLYEYKKILEGKGRYGAVELEIVPTQSGSNVVDTIELERLQSRYPYHKGKHVVTNPIRQHAIKAAFEVMKRYKLPNNIEIRIMDVSIILADSRVADIYAAIVIAIFDICENPLNEKDIKLLDDFVTLSPNNLEQSPDFEKLILTKNQL